jgi:hypothetical protein
MKRPPIRLVGPVLDAANPVELARVYERFLGRAMVASKGPRPGMPPEGGWAKLRSRAGDQKLEFQWEAHYVPPA